MTQADRVRVMSLFTRYVNMDRLSEKGEDVINGMQTAMQGALPIDLGIGSVEFMAFLDDVKEEFGVEVPPEEAHKWHSFDDLLNYLDR